MGIFLSKEYYAKHREEILAKKKSYYENNRERIKQQSRDWHRNNRERFLERKRKYNAAHAQERNEKQKAYAAEHRDEVKAYLKDYYEKHGKAIRQATKQNSRKTIAELEDLLRKIFKMKCFFCGKTDRQPRLGISFHEKRGNSHNYHTIPKLRYILAHPDDFVPLCRHHHILVHRLMMESWDWENIVKLIQWRYAVADVKYIQIEIDGKMYPKVKFR